MRLTDESQILDQDFRRLVIKEINGEENMMRKEQSFRRHDIFNDGTKKYVLKLLEKELSKETMEQMKYRAADISILRKVIDKKSIVYREGVDRIVENETTRQQVDSLTDILNINTAMKKVNKYVELDKNCSVYVTLYADHLTQTKKIKLGVLPAYLYDVIEDLENPEIGRVYILSSMKKDKPTNYAGPNQSGVRSQVQHGKSFREGDGHNQIIADSPMDGGGEEYIWWSDTFHFTTNAKGEFVDGKQEEDLLNPIGVLPFINFAKDKNGSFWAQGGEDLVNGAILVNQMLSDLYYIAKLQGQGLFYLIGPNVPEQLKVGPGDAILLKTKEGDATTQVGFASSNPPIESHMKMIEQYVALLLSTNNLEPGTINGELSAVSSASGIQDMIRRSELMDDIEDQRELYRDSEPLLFQIIAKWHNLLLERGVLHKKLAKLGRIDEEMELILQFLGAKNFLSDMDKLNIIEKRKQLGLDSEIDSLIRDNPDLDRKEAELRLLEIKGEQLRKTSEMLVEEAEDGLESNEEVGS